MQSKISEQRLQSVRVDSRDRAIAVTQPQTSEQLDPPNNQLSTHEPDIIRDPFLMLVYGVSSVRAHHFGITPRADETGTKSALKSSMI
jgi:hypothetical protein